MTQPIHDDWRLAVAATESISWITSSGHTATISVSVQRGEKYYIDRWVAESYHQGGGWRINYTTSINGVSHGNLQYVADLDQRLGSQRLVGRIGKLGLTQDRKDALAAICARMESTPEMLSVRDAEDRAAAVCEKYQEQQIRIDRMTTLGGRSY